MVSHLGLQQLCRDRGRFFASSDRSESLSVVIMQAAVTMS